MLRCCILLLGRWSLCASLAIAGSAQAAAQDAFGDPLPPGATARLGTVRFRHDSTVVFAAFLQGGKSILSISGDGALRVWEFPSGKELRRLGPLAGPMGVTAATLSPDGKHLTAFGADGLLHIWDWANAKQLGTVAHAAGGPRVQRNMLPTAESVYSPDGKTLVLYGTSRIIQLVDLPSGKEVGPGSGQRDSVVAIGFTPDGRQVVTQDALGRHRWDAATGKALAASDRKLPANPGSPTIFSPDGALGVTVSRFTNPAALQAAKARTAIVFDPANGKELATIELALDMTPLYRRPLMFSPNGKVLATIGGEVQTKIDLYTMPSGKLLRSLDSGLMAEPGFGRGGAGGGGGGGGFGGAAGKGGFGGGAGGGFPANPKGKKGAAGFPGVFPGGKGKGGGKGGVATRRVIATAQPLLFSPDGRVLAFRGVRSASIIVVDTISGTTLGTVDPRDTQGNILPSALTPDARCLAFQARAGTVALYEVATGQLRATYGLKGSTTPGGSGMGGGDDDFVLGTGSGSIALYRSPAVFAIAPNGKLLALSGPGGSVHLLDVLTGKELTVLKGHTGAVNALAFAPDGKSLASASADMTGLIWDVSRIARPPLAVQVVKPGELENAWQAMADPDAAKAFVAMRTFAAAPADAVAWIKPRLSPVPPLDRQRVEAWIKQLDDEQFTAREEAAAELEKLGEPVLPVLTKALTGKVTPEARVRLERLRTKLAPVMRNDRLRAYRAVELLEAIGTPEARAVLQALAGGAPGTLVTSSAQAALKR